MKRLKSSIILSTVLFVVASNGLPTHNFTTEEELLMRSNPQAARFSRALATQFETFKQEHPIQAKILRLISDLLIRPSSDHSLVKNSIQDNNGLKKENGMGSRSFNTEELMSPQASNVYSSYSNVRRSGRFLFPDEHEAKARMAEADQERTLQGNGFNNNYRIVNNKVTFGKIEQVPRPMIQGFSNNVGVQFLPRGSRSGRKFEPSLALQEGNDNQKNNYLNFKRAIPQTPNFSEYWKPQILTKQMFQENSQKFENEPGSEWKPLQSRELPTEEEENFSKSQLEFKRPILIDAVPVLRPISSATDGRRGKSINYEFGGVGQGMDSDWQLLGTTGEGSGSAERSSSSHGIGSVEVQPASIFLSSSPENLKELPRVSKVMRPATIKSQPLIVKDARDGRSLKQIEVQGVKIIVGAKTAEFPKDIYVSNRQNYLRGMKQGEQTLSSTVTTL